MKYLVGISGIIFFSFVAITSLVRGCQAIKRLRTPLTVEGAKELADWLARYDYAH